ncbi:hypothetical protein UPYG_G00120110 [Umbra pygmaea]|uniref:Transmembrane protease serine 4-like n=1 Tax=Umbra pygmaea TaxID=75934 RepID=A0ABD0X4T4_UMBPY
MPQHHQRQSTAARWGQRNQGVKQKTAITVFCILVTLAILAVGAYSIWCVVSSRFFCSQSLKFITMAMVCDGRADCVGEEDEHNCGFSQQANATFPVRLVGERMVLQVYSMEAGWSLVCADNWGVNHTRLACQQLGYTLNPEGRRLAVSSLEPSLGKSLSAVRQGTPGPFHTALVSRETCASGSVMALYCSDCGEALGQDRVVGGSDASIEEWPWQASLQKDQQHVCGASLVSLTWLITAAHCFNSRRMDVRHWQVVLGRTQLVSTGSVPVAAIFINKNYEVGTHDYDLAMVQLSRPVVTGDSIRPVCLPPYSLPVKAGDPLVVTGWGIKHEEGELSSVLQSATVSLVERNACSRLSVYGLSITSRMLCAGYMEGKVDACQGDSGGPLVFLSRIWQLVGVVSWGVGCARPGHPGVYCNVEQLLNWIYSVMEKYS